MEDIGGTIVDILKFWGNNLRTNFRNMFLNTSTEQYLQLVIIVGAYLLIRPYLLKYAEKTQAKQYEKELKNGESNTAKAKISPNSLRGKVEVPDDTDEEDDNETSGANWGKKARRRQRKYVKKILSEEEQRLEEEDRLAKEIEDALDEDIKELLES